MRVKDISTALNGDDFNYLETRFPQIYSDSSLRFFQKVAAAKLSSEPLEYLFDSLFPETDSINDDAIKKQDHFPENARDVILTGPMINMGNPFAQCPNRGLRSHRAYEAIDPCDLRASTTVRNAFKVIDVKKAMKFLPKDESLLRSYRIAVRDFIDLNGYRSLVAAILPPEVRHLYTINSIAPKNKQDLLNTSAIWMSLPVDYLVRAIAPGHFDRTTIDTLPNIRLPKRAHARALALVAHIDDYHTLTRENISLLSNFCWSQRDPRLLAPDEIGHSPLNEFSRRAALIEIDVLVSQALGISEEDLLQIYSNNFPVMKSYEDNTWFDASGQIVWTNNKGLPGIGYLEESAAGKASRPSANRWRAIVEQRPSELKCSAKIDYLFGGPHEVTRHFVGPFTQCDRIEDYRRAWAHFERLKSEEAA